MRVEPHTIGSFVHVVNRGTRGNVLVKDSQDRQRFLLMLRHFNDEFCPENWFKDLSKNPVAAMARPTTWPKQKEIIEMLAFCLVENHFHLLIKEIIEGGLVKFMRRLGVGMTNYFNEKYHEKGSLFQGSYRSKTVDDQEYLQHVSAYIQLKNAFELFPGGYKKALQNFDRAFNWANNYIYCSLGEFMGERQAIITKPVILREVFKPSEYKDFCREFIESGSRSDDGGNLIDFE